MSSVRLSLLALALLAACDGNPFAPDPVAPEPEPDPGSISTLPGTTPARASASITRFEGKNVGPNDTDVNGNGFAFQNGQIGINPDNTFTVDNLAFDGDNVYARDTAPDGALPTSVRAFAAAATTNDPMTGVAVDQMTYRALYGASATGRSQFAIVRTGAYVPYGFGGFIYARTGGVTLPTAGDASYTGTYSALRDADGVPADGEKLTYVVGNMLMTIDFDDFNASESGVSKAGAVRGRVTGRRVYDLSGNDITQDVIDQIEADNNLSSNAMGGLLPVLVFDVGPGVIDTRGEIEGGIASSIPTSDGGSEGFESGTYYAVLSGANADEVVGVIVTTSVVNDVTLRETGGFILLRQ